MSLSLSLLTLTTQITKYRIFKKFQLMVNWVLLLLLLTIWTPTSWQNHYNKEWTPTASTARLPMRYQIYVIRYWNKTISISLTNIKHMAFPWRPYIICLPSSDRTEPFNNITHWLLLVGARHMHLL
jgi:hypothetical protein